MILSSCFGLMILALTAAGSAQQQESSDPLPEVLVEPSETRLSVGAELSLELVMSDPDWLGRSPQSPYWSDSSDAVYFSQKREGSDIVDLYVLPAERGEARRVRAEDRGKISADSGTWSQDRRSKVYIHQGDLYVRDLDQAQPRQLTRTVARESDPIFLNKSFSSNPSVGFRRDSRFFARDLVSGLEVELFPLVFEKKPVDQKRDEDKKSTVLARQEERLFEIVRKRERQELEARLQREELAENDPSTTGTAFYLGDEVELGEAVMSSDGRFLLAVLMPKDRPKPERTDMPEWITDSGHVQARKVRPKVGAVEPFGSALVLLDRTTRKVLPLDTSSLPEISNDPLAELREAAAVREKKRLEALAPGGAAAAEDARPTASETSSEASAEAEQKAEDSDKKRPRLRAVRFRNLRFNHDGSMAAFQAFSFDNKDRWLASLEPLDIVDRAANETRGGPVAVTALHHLHDDAWINWSFHDFGFTPDGRSLWLLSEESGYSHLYRIDLESSAAAANDNQTAPVALTAGRYVVSEPQPSPDGQHLYFRANIEHPGQYEIYRIAIDPGSGNRGRQPQQITNFGAMTSARLSPDGTRLAALVSRASRPPELFLQPASPTSARRRQTAVQRTTTTSQAFLRRSWVEPAFVEIPSSHVEGNIHARLYLPEAPRPGSPAVFFVHGAGYLQNAHKGWSSYFREFMFHSFLVQQGYVVLDMDYRASAGYGRDWRTAIYRQMGTPELQDLRDGVDWLVANHGVDRDRIGVYGGSYGGFLTLMALFREPDLFAAGAALRPVTDWAHYNHPYTSNILNTPELDPEAYRQSSPIEFAEGLEKPLLMCSPMLDDNVLFQDSVRLTQRLIELEKTDWWIAPYPVEPHGFREPSSWLDEYRRIFDLFQRFVAGQSGQDR